MAVSKASTSGLAGLKFKDASAGTTKIPDLPGTPTLGAITLIDLGATVAFTPSALGGTPVNYTVTASPGNIQSSGSTSPITLTGLTRAVTYTLTIKANNATASSPESAPSSPIVAKNDSWFLAVTANNTQQYTLPSGVNLLGLYTIGGGFNGSGHTGGSGGTAHSGLVSNPTPGHSSTITVGAAGGGVSSFGSFLDSGGGGNASSKTAGNGTDGAGQPGGNITQSNVGTTYPYGGGGGNGGGGNGSDPHDHWDGYSVHAGGSGGNAGGSPYGGNGGGGGGGHSRFNYAPNYSWNYDAGAGGSGNAGQVPGGGGGGGGGGGHNPNRGTGPQGAAGAGAAGRVYVWEKVVP